MYKFGIAKNSISDCFLVGSSQALVIDKNNIDKITNCNNFFNLSVGVATAEDLIIILNSILKNKNKPKKIFLALEVPSFNYDWDTTSRWRQFEDIYYQNTGIKKNYFTLRYFERYISFEVLKDNIIFLINKQKFINGFQKENSLDSTEPYYDLNGILKNSSQNRLT